MGIRRSNPISTQRIVALKGKIRADLLPKITARIAREELAKVLEVAPAPYTTRVDGREGAPLESVRPGGVIVFTFARLGPVLDWIYEALIDNSPIGPDEGGHYKDDHWLFVNDIRVEAPSADAPLDIPAKSTVIFADLRPYSRKLEGGSSIQAPDGVYEQTAGEAHKKFPWADITFSYRGFQTETPLNSGSKNPAHRAAANRSSNRFPVIIVRQQVS
jgi:hypothetical protein